MGDFSHDPEADRQANLEILMLHVPKTGGTAFRGALSRRYGDALAMRYRGGRWDADLTGKLALTGHFLAREVAHIHAARRVTVLRDPLERAISEYFHHKTTASPGSTYGDRVRAGQPFLEFLAQPAYCTAYTSYYFADADMTAWEVIDHGRLRRQWAEIMIAHGLPPKTREANSRAEVFPGYDDARAELLDDPRVTSAAKSLLARDLAFYHCWAR